VQLLPEYGFSFDLCIFHSQLGDVLRLVEQCPQVSFILDHMGKPGIAAGLTEAVEIPKFGSWPSARTSTANSPA
jgi:L-fuconolactonase